MGRIGSLLVGWAAWTAVEYAAHRWAMHRLRWGPLAGEHRAHHRDPAATSASLRALGVAGFGVVATSAARLVRAPLGAGLGLALGYAAYDQLHWRVHHRAPLGSWERRRRPRHLDHHRHPRRNFGVTTSLWDRLLGTFVEPERVELTRALAPDWLHDQGQVKAAFADRFSLRQPETLADRFSLRQPALVAEP